MSPSMRYELFRVCFHLLWNRLNQPWQAFTMKGTELRCSGGVSFFYYLYVKIRCICRLPSTMILALLKWKWSMLSTKINFTTSSLHHFITASLHHFITSSRHHVITSSLHHIITSSLHHSIKFVKMSSVAFYCVGNRSNVVTFKIKLIKYKYLVTYL